jgi:hypothetical protein
LSPSAAPSSFCAGGYGTSLKLGLENSMIDSSPDLDEIREALALGYCTPANKDKVLDPVLIEAMAQNVYKLTLDHVGFHSFNWYRDPALPAMTKEEYFSRLKKDEVS